MAPQLLCGTLTSLGQLRSTSNFCVQLACTPGNDIDTVQSHAQSITTWHTYHNGKVDAARC